MYALTLAPDEILRTKTTPVALARSKLQKIVSEMKLTLVAQNDPEGVGLAANQVGLPYRLFLARFGSAKDLPAGRQGEPIRVFVNPEILDHSEEVQPENTEKAQMEGCLSVPKYYGVVKRWKWVKLRYQDEKGADKEETFRDFPATVIQHEMDHLDGKIFVERILEQRGKMFKIIGKTKAGKDDWEEVEL
jgi:peptide deformylase